MSIDYLDPVQRTAHKAAVELAQAQLEAARHLVAAKLTSLTNSEADSAAAALAQAIATNYAVEIAHPRR